MGTCGGLIITLAGVRGFYGGLDLPSQLIGIGATTVLSGRVDGTATGLLATVSTYMIAFVDMRGSAVISMHVGFLTIALKDANDFVPVITRTRLSHNE